MVERWSKDEWRRKGQRVVEIGHKMDDTFINAPHDYEKA